MPSTQFAFKEKYRYQNGFNSYHETEAVEGALPIGANSPQKPPYGLYAEKLSGTAFTAPRHENQQTWLYRILPSCGHSNFEPRESKTFNTNPENKPWEKIHYIPNQLRWDPFDLDETVDWVHSLHLVAGAGDPTMKSGVGYFIYAAGKDMEANEAFYSADGDFLIVAQHGVLDIQTELGRLIVRPNEICVIPRGIRYRVTLPEGPVRGYILELYQGHFTLPELGPIGSNCLANARDFQAPIADFDEDTETEWSILAKFAGHLYAAKQRHTPFDDPSRLTIQTRPYLPFSLRQQTGSGTAVADFVIFPPRWLVAEGTFRPPWYHRNTMSEFMGLIGGQYDAKTGGGFQPAGASLHNVMSGHGPDAATHEKASNVDLQPNKVGEGSMAFMFESCLMIGVTDWGLTKCQKIQEGYNAESWEPLKPHFKRPGPKKIDNGVSPLAAGSEGDKGQVPHYT
ncbi:unnamed protein product [Alternaria alternata]